MAAIVLVRHASTAWSGRRYCGISDLPLSRAGRAEAIRLAAELAVELPGTTRIVSSPSRRAVATATAIAEAAGLAGVDIDGRWQEADVGRADGRTFDELAVIAPDIAARLANGDAIIDWPDGETSASLADRVAAAWSDVLANPRPTVVVTHAGPFMYARALAEGRPASSADLVAPATAIRLEIDAAGGGERRPCYPPGRDAAPTDLAGTH